MKRTFRRVTFKERLILFWGKLRRFYYHNCDSSRIRKGHARRSGECARCGACCNLAHGCPSLEFTEDGLTLCTIHTRRPKNCRIFPVNEKDIADRNLLAPDIPCGYSFKPEDDS